MSKEPDQEISLSISNGLDTDGSPDLNLDISQQWKIGKTITVMPHRRLEWLAFSSVRLEELPGFFPNGMKEVIGSHL